MRKTKPKKRILLPDPKFHDVMVTRFVNNLMLQGKKSIAYSIFYDAIDMVGEKMKDSRSASGKEDFTLDEEYDRLRPQAFRPLYGRKALCRDNRSIQLRRCGIQEKRRHAQDGRGQQGICTFPFLIPN